VRRRRWKFLVACGPSKIEPFAKGLVKRTQEQANDQDEKNEPDGHVCTPGREPWAAAVHAFDAPGRTGTNAMRRRWRSWRLAALLRWV
jgi:hypothetical protein